MNDKFKLDVKTISPEQCREWIAIIKAKKNLHSVDKLAENISVNDFRTKTFASLLFLKDAEQVHRCNVSLCYML